MSVTRLLLCASALLLPVNASAQDSTRVVPLDTLAVTVTRAPTSMARVPAAVSVIRRNDIQGARLTIGLDEALAQVPGLLANNRYNFALGTRISIRGFGSRAAFGVRGIRLIADGIPLTTADGQSNLNNIDLAAADRIEVLRGAASMLYGNAAGGVIEIESERPAAGLSAEVRGVLGEYQRRGLDDLGKINVKVGGGSQDLRFLVSAARVAADGFREHSRFEQTNLMTRVDFARSDKARSALTLSLADAPVAENPGSLPLDSAELSPSHAWPRNIATGAGERSRQLQAGLQHEHRLGSVLLDASAYALTRTLQNPLPFAYIDLDRTAGGVRSTLAWRGLLLGLDFEGQSDDRAEHDNVSGQRGSTQTRDQTDRIASIGPFVRASADLTDRLTATLGFRYDRSHFEVADRLLSDGRDDSGARTMSAFSPSGGVTLRLNGASTLYGSMSTSFQTPTTTEMINTPPAPGQPCCAAGFNPLNPEKSVALEAGIRTTLGNRVSIDAALYQMHIRDEIVPFQVANADGREFFRNAGRTRHQGLELAAMFVLTSSVRVTTSYTYSHFIFRDDGIASASYEGNALPGVPPHHLLVRGALRMGGIVAEPEAEWTARYFADDANTAINHGFTLVNLRVRTARPYAGLTPFAAMNNITDVRYNSSVVINAAGARYFEPAPGVNFYVGLSAHVGRGGLSQ